MKTPGDADKTTGAVVASVEARKAIDTSKPIEEQLRAAMTIAKDFRMMDEDDVRFTGAVLAVVQANADNIEIYVRIMAEIIALQSLSALTSPTPVDVEAIVLAQKRLLSPIGLRQIWIEVAHSDA